MNHSRRSTRIYRSVLLFLAILVPAAILIAVLRRLVSTLLSAKHKITIFGRRVLLASPIRRSGHEQPFVNMIDVEALHCVTANGLTREEIQRCVSALSSRSLPPSLLEAAVQLFVFTTDENGSPRTISFNRTHAFSILTYRDDQLEHHYFEKQNASVFQKVPSLSMPLTGPLDIDDVRLLHFAAAGKHTLPLKSTIYEFNSGAWARRAWHWKKNIALRISLLRDQDRNVGAPTLGLYGDEVYLALGGAAGEHCGGDRDCPEGDDTCGLPPGGPDKVCGAVRPGGDIFVDISRELKNEGIVSPIPLNFGLLKSLRKDLLMPHKKGREYVSQYYIAALFTKFDPILLDKYMQVIPEIDTGVRALLSGSDQTIIVTTKLRDSMLDIIANHRDVENREFQRVLDIAENDLKYFHGMTRDQVMDSLTH